MSLRPRARLALAATAAVALAGLAPVAVQAADPGASSGAAAAPVARAAQGPKVTVMTQNLYLGSSLDPAMQAEGATEFGAAVAEIYATSVRTDFPTRAKAVAATIAQHKPDLVGLQEVSNWVTLSTKEGANPPSFDFLQILMDELKALGLKYRVAGVSNNAAIDGKPFLPNGIPLYAPQFGCEEASLAASDCYAKFYDRDVILERTNRAGLELGKPVSGQFETQQTFVSPLGEIDFGRGWVYVDGTLDGRKFRFANTHLEIEQFEGVQVRQGIEFLQGAARTRRPLIATGDFNSAADDSNTPTYRMLTMLLDDVWDEGRWGAGLTCCQVSDLSNTESDYDKRIDLVLTRKVPTVLGAQVVSDDPINDTGTVPVWAADHGGVVARLRLK